MIAVTFALPTESSVFVRRLSNAKRDSVGSRGCLEYSRAGKILQREVSVFHTGVGASECERRLGEFLKTAHPRVLISSGFCGGTGDELAPGDLIIAENYSDAALTKRARTACVGATIEKLFSTNKVIDSTADRYAVARKHGALAIDMETESIARICKAKSVPMLALRVVSDSPSAPFPAAPQLLFDMEAQRTKYSRLLGHLVRHPVTAIRLATFSRQIALARKKLADALCAVIAAL